MRPRLPYVIIRFREPEGKLGIFIERKAAFGLSFCVLPNGLIAAGIFAPFGQLMEIFADRLIFTDVDVWMFFDDRTVAAGWVMVKFENPPSVLHDADHSEAHALTDPGKVEHTAVRSDERPPMCFAEIGHDAFGADG